MVGGLCLMIVGAAWSEENEGSIMLGAAKVEVTPEEPVVLAGYGARTTELEGIDTKLWARAVAIGEKDPLVMVVLDNCGVPAAVRERLLERLQPHGITTDRLVVAATHTHNAPNLVGYAPILWAGRTTEAQEARMAAYTEVVIGKMESVVRAALEAREPMSLSWGKGRATFGGNRRVLKDGTWSGFGFQRDGPVDHSLPVLSARDGDGRVRVVWANYACHCTTVGSRNHVSGDWAGYANDSIEAQLPDATALTTIGCGADINPEPRGTLALAEEYGKQLAGEVTRLLQRELRPIRGPLRSVREVVDLPLEEPMERGEWEAMRERGRFDGELAKSMLALLDAGKAIPTTVPYPVTGWHFGDDLAMVFLPGEVVVDYAIRLNRELDWSRLWVTAWSNGMPGYIPSKRVLAEGGYEAEFSQVYYGQPGRYRPEVEDVVVGAVRAVAGDGFLASPGQKPAPYHRWPERSSEEAGDR